MKAVMIQQSVGEKWTELHLKMMERNVAYCQKHGIGYQGFFGRQDSADENMMWDRVLLIFTALANFDFVIWMDLDSIIVDQNTSLVDAGKEFENVGMVKHYTEGWRHQDWHYNAGVAFFKSTERTRHFLEEVLTTGQVEHPRWKVQATFLYINDFRNVISEVKPKWNSTVNTNEVENPVVRSWHGQPDRFEKVLKEISQ